MSDFGQPGHYTDTAAAKKSGGVNVKSSSLITVDDFGGSDGYFRAPEINGATLDEIINDKGPNDCGGSGCVKAAIKGHVDAGTKTVVASAPAGGTPVVGLGDMGSKRDEETGCGGKVSELRKKRLAKVKANAARMQRKLKASARRSAARRQRSHRRNRYRRYRRHIRRHRHSRRHLRRNRRHRRYRRSSRYGRSRRGSRAVKRNPQLDAQFRSLVAMQHGLVAKLHHIKHEVRETHRRGVIVRRNHKKKCAQ